MPEYRYSGYDTSGKKTKGRIMATSVEAALEKLKHRQIHIEHIEPVRIRKPFYGLSGNLEQLSLFSRHLSVLLASGASLSEALSAVSEEFTGQWASIVNRISERVQEGASLSAALREQNGIFPEYYCRMLEASEQSGNLAEVLEMLSQYIDLQRTVNSRIVSALIYPSFMIVVAVFVLSFVFTFVVPKVVKLFESSKASLPFITEFLINTSEFLSAYWWLLLIVMGISVYALRRLHNRYPWLLHGILLKVPIFRALYYSRFTATLGFLLKAGVPIIKALELSSSVTGNSTLQHRAQKAIQRVSEGASLASAFEGLPAVLKQMISTGERSGTLAELMLKASETYREELFRGTERLTSLIEPVMILIMGVAVGVIVFGVLLPLFQLNQIVR